MTTPIKYTHFKDPVDGSLHALKMDGTDNKFYKSHWIRVEDNQVDQERQRITQEQFDKMSYAEKRMTSYPPMSDFLDAIVKDDQAAIRRYIETCRMVKQLYPKDK